MLYDENIVKSRLEELVAMSRTQIILFSLTQIPDDCSMQIEPHLVLKFKKFENKSQKAQSG